MPLLRPSDSRRPSGMRPYVGAGPDARSRMTPAERSSNRSAEAPLAPRSSARRRAHLAPNRQPTAYRNRATNRIAGLRRILPTRAPNRLPRGETNPDPTRPPTADPNDGRPKPIPRPRRPHPSEDGTCGLPRPHAAPTIDLHRRPLRLRLPNVATPAGHRAPRPLPSEGQREPRPHPHRPTSDARRNLRPARRTGYSGAKACPINGATDANRTPRRHL